MGGPASGQILGNPGPLDLGWGFSERCHLRRERNPESETLKGNIEVLNRQLTQKLTHHQFIIRIHILESPIDRVHRRLTFPSLDTDTSPSGINRRLPVLARYELRIQVNSR